MALIEVARTIDAPVQRVFHFFSDIPSAARNLSSITKIEMLSDGPIGVDTRWKETRILFGREVTEKMKITEFVENSHYTVEANSCGAHYRTEIRFRPVDRMTEVTMQLQIKPVSVAAKLMSPLTFLMRGTMVKFLDQDMEEMKQLCEQFQSSPVDSSAGQREQVASH
jgi:uncharacterized membrane protein